MKFIQILFKIEMVLAILSGRKTITRRIVKNQPPKSGLQVEKVCRDWNHVFKGYTNDSDIDIWTFGKCP